jgi:hypothetical protein
MMTLPDEFMDGSIPAIFMPENYIMAATRSPGLDGNCSWGGAFGGWVLSFLGARGPRAGIWLAM